MDDDPIITEVRANRQALLDRFGDDLEALARHVNEEAVSAGCHLESLAAKRIPPEAPKPEKKAS